MGGLFGANWPSGRTIVTGSQLGEAGLGRRVLAGGVKHGLLHQPWRGVYIPRHLWLALPPWEQDRCALVAHAVAGRGVHVYTHFSAALLHGLTVWGRGREVHVNIPHQSSPSRQPADVHHHVAALGSQDVTTLLVPDAGAVRLTTLERTVVDCAMAARFDQAVVIGDSALARGVDPARLQETLLTMEGRRGVRKARRVLAALNGSSESAGESRTRLIIAELPVEMPELQITVFVNGREYRPDFAWRDRKLIVEFDGDTKYFDFGPTARALVDERERESALIEAGWHFVRIKWKHLERPDEVKARILAAYQASRRNEAA
ncbi:hypothetical protein AL755_14790 [Arthrobacter sp. ERGS1:01]|nr:hypothetical protein AL755_14790 [Arthrobacter sp. ERGS1:01]